MTRCITDRSLGVVLAVCALVLTGSCARADWPQLLGPTRNGISTETGLARSWPEVGPKLVWQTTVTDGFSGPAVYQGKVYVTDRVPKQQDLLRCLDLATGKEEWRYAYDAPGMISQDGSRCTPAVNDKYVFFTGEFGHLTCLDRATHQPVWTKQLMTEYEGKRAEWGCAQCPVLYKNTVIVAPQGNKAGVVALDQATGAEVWTADLPGNPGYVSPMLATVEGVDQILALSVPQRGRGPRGGQPTPSTPGVVLGLDAATGKELWRFTGFQCQIPIAAPMPVGDGRFFITGGYGAGSVMIRVTRQGDTFSASQVFATQAAGAQIHMPILYKGYLYIVSNDNSRADGLVCMDLDGNLRWNTRYSPNFERGGIIEADGMLIVMDGDKGVLRLVDPNPDAYKELAAAKVIDGKRTWAPLALVDGMLLVRGQAELKCFDLKAH